MQFPIKKTSINNVRKLPITIKVNQIKLNLVVIKKGRIDNYNDVDNNSNSNKNNSNNNNNNNNYGFIGNISTE